MPQPTAGPVLVVAEHDVPDALESEFLAAMQPVQRSRRRTGRLTGFDRAAEERVHRLVGAPPRVRHLLAVDLGERRRR